MHEVAAVPGLKDEVRQAGRRDEATQTPCQVGRSEAIYSGCIRNTQTSRLAGLGRFVINLWMCHGDIGLGSPVRAAAIAKAHARYDLSAITKDIVLFAVSAWVKRVGQG